MISSLMEVPALLTFVNLDLITLVDEVPEANMVTEGNFTEVVNSMNYEQKFEQFKNNGFVASKTKNASFIT